MSRFMFTCLSLWLRCDGDDAGEAELRIGYRVAGDRQLLDRPFFNDPALVVFPDMDDLQSFLRDPRRIDADVDGIAGLRLLSVDEDLRFEGEEDPALRQLIVGKLLGRNGYDPDHGVLRQHAGEGDPASVALQADIIRVFRHTAEAEDLIKLCFRLG